MAGSHDREGQPGACFTAAEPEAASSLHTTPCDFARFLCAMMAPGGGSWQLGMESLAEMLKPQARLDDAVSWGLGWGLQTTNQGRAFWHWGDNPGFKSFAFAFPDLRAGLVVMTNGDGGLTLWEPIVRTIFDGDHPAFAWLAGFYGVPRLDAVP